MAAQVTPQDSQILSYYTDDPARAQVGLVPADTDLTRLYFFDGRYLRATHLDTEQAYVRTLARLANQAGGSGVVFGFETRLVAGPGNKLFLGRGLAIDSQGRVLYLQRDVEVDLDRLLNPHGHPASPGPGAFQPQPPPQPDGQPVRELPRLYWLTLSLTEVPHGQEEVFGLNCSDACQRPSEPSYRLEGVTLSAVPRDEPALGGISDAAVLRGQLASLVFQRELDELRGSGQDPQTLRAGPLVDLDGPAGPAGARFSRGTPPPGEAAVPLAVLAMRGPQVLFLDPWIARRERAEAPGPRVLGGLLGLRPFDQYLAQIFQFHHQLYELSLLAPPPQGDPQILEQTVSTLKALDARNAGLVPGDLLARLNDLLALQRFSTRPGGGASLKSRGFTDLPPAGFLPVVPDSVIRQQVAQLLGEDVRFRLLSVHPNTVARALLLCQHNQRIPLTTPRTADPGAPGAGVVDPRPLVDVLVPDLPPNQRPHWVLFCQGFASEISGYREIEEVPAAGTYLCYQVYRTPLTAYTDQLSQAHDMQGLRQVSLLVGKAYFDKGSGNLLERFFHLDQSWGRAARLRYLVIQDDRLKADNSDDEEKLRNKELGQLDTQLAPTQAFPPAWYNISRKTYSHSDEYQLTAFLFTPFRARVVAFTDKARRVALRSEVLEAGPDGNVVADQAKAIIKSAQDQATALYPAATLASADVVTLAAVVASPFQGALGLRDQLIESQAFDKATPGASRPAALGEELLFLENGMRADALIYLVFKTP